MKRAKNTTVCLLYFDTNQCFSLRNKSSDAIKLSYKHKWNEQYDDEDAGYERISEDTVRRRKRLKTHRSNRID